MTPTLAQLDRCFQRILPGVIATADADGVPNVNYVSQLVVVDERHLALSYQFATKTRANLAANPRAALEVYDPLTLDAYRLELRLARVETAGPSFDLLAARIAALASHTGLADVFKLRAAYVCEVLAIERRAGFIAGPAVAPPPTRDPMAEAAGLMRVSERIAAAADLDGLLVGALAALADGFGFHHGRILVPDGDGRLVTIASHGYTDGAVGGEVRIGEGLIGVVAQTRRLVRALGIDADLRYARELRAEIARGAGASRLAPEVPLPGLPDARSQLALPLLAHDRLLGVLALESRDTLTFAQWHEPFLQVLANQIALSMEHMAERDDDEPPAPSLAPPPLAHRARTFCYYANDDCVFVDDAYLVRNVPGKILWKLLRAFAADGRTAWSNRELRLDPTLGLPALKDNLESRLILLRKRLADKCPELALVPTRRGHFRLEVACRPTLIERASA